MVPRSKCQDSWQQTVSGITGVKELQEDFPVLRDRSDWDVPELSCSTNEVS